MIEEMIGGMIEEMIVPSIILPDIGSCDVQRTK